jgi:hypothetical protein
MRKLILATALMFVWAHPAFARGRLPTACCQFGVTYGGGATNSVTCETISIFPKATDACVDSGGKVTAGPCESDGVCAGSPTCCEGVSIFEGCTPPIGGGPGTAEPESCAKALESACDGVSPAGEHSTRSVPGATCTAETMGSFCVTPVP